MLKSAATPFLLLLFQLCCELKNVWGLKTVMEMVLSGDGAVGYCAVYDPQGQQTAKSPLKGHRLVTSKRCQKRDAWTMQASLLSSVQLFFCLPIA